MIWLAKLVRIPKIHERSQGPQGLGALRSGEPQSFAEVSRPFDRVLALSFHILWFELDLLAERVGAQPGKSQEETKSHPQYTVEVSNRGLHGLRLSLPQFGYILWIFMVHLGQSLTSFLRQCVVEVSTPCFRPCLDSLGASVTMEGWPWRYPKWIVKKGDVSDTLQTLGIILRNIDMFGFF